MPDISEIALSGRPLIISDVDDVVLQFISPFEKFLTDAGLRFVPRSFHFSGNIERLVDGTPIEDIEIKNLLDRFFDSQHSYQQPFEHAHATLTELSEDCDIVFLTAMPPKFATQRKRHLENLGLPFPIIATETAKGPVAARIAANLTTPVVFVDDMAHNLFSVGEHLPHCLLLSLTPPSEVHRLAPRPPESARPVTDWRDALRHIRTHFCSDRDINGSGTSLLK